MANIAQYSTVQQCITLQVQSKCKSISFGNILYQIQTFFPSQNNNTTTKNKSWLQGLKTTKKQKTNKHYKQQQQCTVLTARNLLISSWHEVVKIEKRKGRGKKIILTQNITDANTTNTTHLGHTSWPFCQGYSTYCMFWSPDPRRISSASESTRRSSHHQVRRQSDSSLGPSE